ncbi:MAG: aldo/keto reductase [Kiritimatiellota bacterium]|nr:aldo/keto reductase [Kiritimatiellota bacterium]
MRRALELGMNLADTSADYGDNERVFGEVLHTIDKPCIVSTKLGPRAGTSGFNPKDKDCLRRIFEQSLAFLHRDTIDILMIHEPDRPGQYDWYNGRDDFHGPVTELLQELKDEGLVRFTGLGGTTVYQLACLVATGEYDVVLTAFNSSPLWQEAIKTVIPEAKKRNVGVMLASPTQQGWLAVRYDEQVERGAPWLSPMRQAQFKKLYELVDELGIPIPVFCLRWALSIPDVSTVLTGPGNLEQLEQNVTASEQGPLPSDIMKRVGEIAAMVPFRPCEEPFGCQFRSPKYWGPKGIR